MVSLSREEAVFDLIREARADRVSNASAQRTVRALRFFGLDHNEIVRVLSYLEICRTDGTPYNSKIKRTW